MKQQNSNVGIREFRKLLRKFEREFNGQLRQTVDCCGVTVIQCHTLLEIEDRGISNMKDIADFFRIDKSTLSRTISILVERGLVEREVNPGNRREINLKLTTEGVVLCHDINEICDSFYAKILNYVPPVRAQQLFEALNEFNSILEKSHLESCYRCGEELIDKRRNK